MTTFRGPIDRATACFSDRPALVDGLSGEVTTFADLGRHTRAVAVHLDRLGVPPGGRVAFLADGSVPYAEWYLGVPAAGRIFVPLNTRPCASISVLNVLPPPSAKISKTFVFG